VVVADAASAIPAPPAITSAVVSAAVAVWTRLADL